MRLIEKSRQTCLAPSDRYHNARELYAQSDELEIVFMPNLCACIHAFGCVCPLLTIDVAIGAAVDCHDMSTPDGYQICPENSFGLAQIAGHDSQNCSGKAELCHSACT
jgi:hypothetical protein